MPKRRGQAARTRAQSAPPEARRPPFAEFNPADPATWPPLLRLTSIVANFKTGYCGILPMSRAAFLRAVDDDYIAKPVKLGGKVVAWRKDDILEIIRRGVQRPPPRRGPGRPPAVVPVEAGADPDDIPF